MEEALKFIDALAARLQAPAHVIWEAYVRQAAVQGAASIVQYAILILLVVQWSRVWSPRLLAAFNGSRKHSNYSGGEGYFTAVLIGWIAVLVLSLIAFFEVTNTITMLVNPNYWAIQRMLGR